MESESKVFVAGHRGLVGSAIVRRLKGEARILTAERKEMDLREQADVRRWFEENRPEFVFLVAGTVGGILANSTRPAEFFYDNCMIHANVIEAAWRTGVRKLLYLGSSCIYPRECPQPMKEEYLMTGSLEPTNQAYAAAKLGGIMQCLTYRRQYGCDFISGLPTNLYGPGDNFDLKDSHVLPALIRKFHEGDGTVWGSGRPTREFLHVDDLADACVFLMRSYSEDAPINIGSGVEISIRDLAELVRDVVAPGLELKFDASKPDGMPRKVTDVSRLSSLGWKASIELREGIRGTYDWYKSNLRTARVG